MDRARAVLADNQRYGPRQRARRYEAMRASPHAFFRLTPERFAADLAALGAASGIVTWLQGDAQLENAGARAGAGGEVFDFLDFGQTMPGPCEWDLCRAAVSACLAADGQDPAAGLLAGYRQHLEAMAGTRLEELPHLDVPAADAAPWLPPLEDAGWLERHSEPDETGRRRFALGGEVVPLEEKLLAEVAGMLAAYAPTVAPRHQRPPAAYRPVDVAVWLDDADLRGREAFLALLADDTVLLIEEAPPCALAPYRPAFSFAHDAQRVMAGERVLSTADDPYLGHTFGRDRPFVVRTFDPGRRQAELCRVSNLPTYLDVFARLLAKAHTRGAAARDVLALLAREPQFLPSLADWAAAHARQVEQDYQDFVSLLPA